MNDPKHRIWRQVLDLEVRQASQDTAWRLQHRLSRLHRQHIVPLIDRCCTELSPQGRLHRIESLVIDLGHLNLGNLEDSLLESLEPCLKSALAEHITELELREDAVSRQQQNPESSNELEMLAFFADTGNVPWWADSSRSNLVDLSLGLLIRRTPRKLVSWIQRLASDRSDSKEFSRSSSIMSPVLSGQGLRRIVLHCDDERLVELFGILDSPSRRGWAVSRRSPMALLQSCRAASGATSARFRSTAWRNALWLAVLQTACFAEARSPRSEGFWQEVLARIAMELHWSYASVMAGLRQILWASALASGHAGPSPSHPSLPRAQEPRLMSPELEDIWRVLVPSPLKDVAGRQSSTSNRAAVSLETEEPLEPQPPAEAAGSSPLVLPEGSLEEIERILNRLRRRQGPLKSLFAALRSVAGRLPNRLRGQWWTILKDLEAPTPQERFYASNQGREGDARDFHPTRMRILLRLLAPLIEWRLLSLQNLGEPEHLVSPRVSLPAEVAQRSLIELQGPWDESLEAEEAKELTLLLQKMVATEGTTTKTAGRASNSHQPSALESHLPESSAAPLGSEAAEANSSPRHAAKPPAPSLADWVEACEPNGFNGAKTIATNPGLHAVTEHTGTFIPAGEDIAGDKNLKHDSPSSPRQESATHLPGKPQGSRFENPASAHNPPVATHQTQASGAWAAPASRLNSRDQARNQNREPRQTSESTNEPAPRPHRGSRTPAEDLVASEIPEPSLLALDLNAALPAEPMMGLQQATGPREGIAPAPTDAETKNTEAPEVSTQASAEGTKPREQMPAFRSGSGISTGTATEEEAESERLSEELSSSISRHQEPIKPRQSGSATSAHEEGTPDQLTLESKPGSRAPERLLPKQKAHEPNDLKQANAKPSTRPFPDEEPLPVLESEEIEQILSRLSPKKDPLAEIFEELHRITKHLSPRVRKEWSPILRDLYSSAPLDLATPGLPASLETKEKIQPARAADLLRLLRPLLGTQEALRREGRRSSIILPEGAAKRCLRALEGAPGAAVPAGVATELARLLRKSLRATHPQSSALPPLSPFSPMETHPELRKRSFSETETVCVENSGLVLLWPFLGHFFQHLGLMTERITPQASTLRFRDAAARQRAVGLLQYLVTENPSPPEYQVTLGKVLCGMPPNHIFEPGEPISSAEAEECSHLLTAATTQAPILKNMSTEGFRGTFLLRKGVLSTCDGVWLLRVERQAYDLVLDRLPWGANWVKLPWMEAPLRVEW